MYASTSALPELPALTNGLSVALETAGIAGHGVRVVDRRKNPYASSLPSEFITCRLRGGQELNLFCKYTGEDFEHCHGHRGSAGHEATVYSRLLSPLNVHAPRYFGTCPSPDGTGSWVFLEQVVDVERLTEHTDPERALISAAGEIGRFQHACDASYVRRADSFLTPYDRDYYLGWLRRTVEYAGERHQRFTWLVELRKRCEAMFDPLLLARQTVIHGEFYPHNVLCRGREIFLIDWQSTAIGPGEIDLAALTEKWPDDVVEECIAAYTQARWPNGAPDEFDDTLAAARLYLIFRWLGDRPEWTNSPRSEWGFEQLRILAERLELISR